MKATSAQINYAKHLCRELGYDPDDYDLEHMTGGAVSNLICELKAELEG